MNRKRQAIFIADLGFGDAGKGTITDFLTRELAAHTIVRYNGGPQAAHTVVTPEGRSHTFAQFGSGILLPRTKTLLSRFMLINPLNMLKEERHLQTLGVTDALERTLIDRHALVITPFQKAINRLREIARAANRHGSCGEGIGECMADHLKYGNAVLLAGDLQERATLLKKLRFLHDVKRDEFSELCHHLPDTEQVRQECAVFTAMTDGGKMGGVRAQSSIIEACADVYQYFSDGVDLVDGGDIQSLFAQPGTILFEGAQGVLLDENYGFVPYTTWSTTTLAHADTLIREHNYDGEVIKLGVVRAYATRHGAGPFPTEDRALTLAIPDQHNTWNDWQQAFRIGHFDMVATRYARDVISKLDYLAITNVDRLEALPEWKICNAYSYQGEEKELSAYFDLEGKRLTKLKVPPSIDLSRQEELTYKLWSCEPEYQSFSPKSGTQIFEEESAAYLSLIEEGLSIPIAITSYGPTAVDKQCSRDFMKHVC